MIKDLRNEISTRNVCGQIHLLERVGRELYRFVSSLLGSQFGFGTEPAVENEPTTVRMPEIMMGVDAWSRIGRRSDFPERQASAGDPSPRLGD